MLTGKLSEQNNVELFQQHMASFFSLSPTSSHPHPLHTLQLKIIEMNSQLEVDNDFNGTFGLERVNYAFAEIWLIEITL